MRVCTDIFVCLCVCVFGADRATVIDQLSLLFQLIGSAATSLWPGFMQRYFQSETHAHSLRFPWLSVTLDELQPAKLFGRTLMKRDEVKTSKLVSHFKTVTWLMCSVFDIFISCFLTFFSFKLRQLLRAGFTEIFFLNSAWEWLCITITQLASTVFYWSCPPLCYDIITSCLFREPTANFCILLIYIDPESPASLLSRLI